MEGGVRARDVESCSSLLSEMESIMAKYQIDLDQAVNGIQNLQVGMGRVYYE